MPIETPGSLSRAATAALLVSSLASVGAPAPPPRIAGEVDEKELALRVAQEKGRVVLVNFWATWCVPCREEFPDLVRLQKSHGFHGLQILGVSVDPTRETAAVERFLAEHNPNFPNYRKKSGGDEEEFIKAVDGSWGGELPFTVLYNREGHKVKVLSGKHSYRRYEREIRGLLSVGRQRS